jgi:solute carrier family 35 protein E1
VHTAGNLLTNVSLGKVAVSFTHTVKALEPLFSIGLSTAFFGDLPSRLVLLSLAPIVGGVALASASEATFNWLGFLSAMGSNLTFQSRNVLSKLLMGGRKPLDNINLFSLITLISLPLTLPIALLAEGVTSPIPVALANPVANQQIVQQIFIAGTTFHLYQQVSYMILQRVVPVTHSIGNCVKRVVIIASSIVVFQNPVSGQNAAGTTLALLGVFAYNYVRPLRSMGLLCACDLIAQSALNSCFLVARAGEARRESQVTIVIS